MPEEAHIVRRAIIMAAGTGKRMRPLTYQVPKPLVKVNGVRMIDTVVDALKKNGIDEIYAVVGHLKEQFYAWAEGKDIGIIENPYYETCNNMTSLYVARAHLSDCMILDGDQIIYNPTILDPHFTLSGYNAVWCEGKTDEWLMKVEDGIVKSCSTRGGAYGWQLYSISRWSTGDGAKLRGQLEHEFEVGNRQIYWDNIPMVCYPQMYTLGIYRMHADDVIEIDGLDELAAIDHSYRGFPRERDGFAPRPQNKEDA